MNKGEFVKAVAENGNFTQKDMGRVVDVIIDTIYKTLEKGEKIQIAGFGTFEIVDKPAQQKINPLTKKPVKVEACRQPKFKFGKSFKALFNN